MDLVKPKAKTRMERYGFVDEDKRKPLHDEIQIWIHKGIEDRNSEIFKKIVDIERKKFLEIINKETKNIKIPYIIKNVVSDEPKVINIEWEKMIKDKRYPIGYIDLYFLLCFPFKCNKNYDKIINYRYWSTEEQYIISRIDFEEGRDYTILVPVFIEIKTKILSIGDLIRQINTYREYEYGSYYVVAPENKNAKGVLFTQNIKYLEYPFKSNKGPMDSFI